MKAMHDITIAHNDRKMQINLCLDESQPRRETRNEVQYIHSNGNLNKIEFLDIPQ